jgi:hypothetical protein
MKNFLTVFLLLFFLLSSSFLTSQAQLINATGVNKIHLSDSDRFTIAEINPLRSKPILRLDRYYYWFSSNSIKRTQGGYSDKLLNGLYSEYYLTKNLREQGIFIAGLKNKLWKTWNIKGVLIKKVNWENGLKNGDFETYDEWGNLIEKGTYSQNELQGKLYTYSKDSVSVIRYHGGELVPAVIPSTSSFFKRLNIFRHRNKDTTLSNAINVPIERDTIKIKRDTLALPKP